MAINHEVPTVRFFRAVGLGKDDGVAVGGAKAGFEADLLAVFNEPGGAANHVFAVGGLRGDTGEADVIAEFAHKPFPVCAEIIQNNIHAREYLEPKLKAKWNEFFSAACSGDSVNRRKFPESKDGSALPRRRHYLERPAAAFTSSAS